MTMFYRQGGGYQLVLSAAQLDTLKSSPMFKNMTFNVTRGAGGMFTIVFQPAEWQQMQYTMKIDRTQNIMQHINVQQVPGKAFLESDPLEKYHYNKQKVQFIK